MWICSDGYLIVYRISFNVAREFADFFEITTTIYISLDASVGKCRSMRISTFIPDSLGQQAAL